MSRRTWIKIYCEGIMNMVHSDFSLSDIGVWTLLLSIAGNGNYGDIGVIAHTHNLGISVNDIARILGISVRQWYRYRDRFVNEGMITVTDTNVIIINNYGKYQAKFSDKSGKTARSQIDRFVNTSKSKKESKSKKRNTTLDDKAKALLKKAGIPGPDQPDASEQDHDNEPEVPDDSFTDIEPF